MKKIILIIISILICSISYTQVVYTFNGNGNWNDTANWLNNSVPPDTLLYGDEIIIDSNLTCYLNVPQTISIGASLLVLPGADLIVMGNLIDYNLWPSVTICNQAWMAKNLNVTTYRNGDSIPQITDPTQWANLTTGAWCWYNNDSATYGPTYGKLYNWYAVNDPRGLPPIGWHVPSDAEWNSLVECLDSAADTSCINCYQSSIAGGLMKETDTAHWVNPNYGATNSSGFTGLPAGTRYNDGTFGSITQYGYWWSSSQSDSANAAYRLLLFNNSFIYRSNSTKINGLSVRCVKDSFIK